MDHRNSISNRIDQIKKNYEKNKESSQESQEATNKTKANFVPRGSVYDRVKFIEGQLEKKKFGINENKFKKENPDSSQKGLENQSTEGINNNISNESLDFETRKRRYETVKKDQIPSQNTNMIFKSNEQMIDFLSQAKTMCEDYEKEIALLRNKLSSQSNFNKLQISEKNLDNNLNFNACSSNYFINKLLEISKQASPDFNMLNAVYSDKITELFLENEKLETQIKSSIGQQDKTIELEKTIEDLKFKVKDKDIYIENMNEIYANKFTEIYNENDGLKKQIEDKNELIQILQTKLNEKNQEFEEYKIKNLNEMNELEDNKINLETLICDKAKEIETLKEEFEKERITLLDNYQANKKQIEEYDVEKSNLEKEIKEINRIFNLKKNELENLNKEFVKIKEKFEESEEENKRLFKEIEDSKKNFDRLISAKEEIIENFDRKFAEKEDIYIKEQIYLKEKIEENEKEMVNKDLMLIQLKQDFENKSRDVVIIKGDFNTGNKLFEDQVKIESNIKQNDEEQNINMNLNSEEIENLKNESKIQLKELNEKILSLNSLIQKLSEDLKTKENSIKELEVELKSLEKDLEKSKKKSKEAVEETDNLREIIAKDQLRIKELKEFKEKALEGKIDLNSLPIDKVDSHFNLKSNKENQEIINTSEYNILLEKLKEEKSKSKVICDEYRKLQENFSNLKLENSKKEKVIEANIKMIEELKVRLKNKIKLDEILLQNKNKTINTGLDTVNLGVCYNCSNQIDNLTSNNFKSYNSSFINAPNLESQRARSKTNLNLPDTLSNKVARGGINSPSKNINLNECNINDSVNNIQDNNNVSSTDENFNDGLNKNPKILKINENKNETKNRVTFEQFNLCKMLIVENLLLNYQLSQSISLNFLVEVLMKNFNFLYNTVFINGYSSNSFGNQVEKNVVKENQKNLKKVDTNIIKLNSNNSNTIDSSYGNSNIFGMNQISIFHEFLEDIILKIYDIAIKNKNDKKKNLIENNNVNDGNKKEVKENSTNRFGKTIINLFSSKKSANENTKSPIEDEIYKISKEDFTFELTKKITTEVSGNNILHNLINANRTNKPIIQELFNNFSQKFEKHFDFEFLNISEKNTSYYEIVNIKLQEYLNNEIKSVLVENIKNYDLNTNNKIQILIDKISQNIQDGILLNSLNKSAVYNFKYFNKQYSDFNFILRRNQDTNDTKSISKNTEEMNLVSRMDENNLLDHISENSVITNSTLIINLSNIDDIISNRHSFDYFNFLIKSHNSEINKIAFKGDIKKNIDFKSIYNLFLNILLYNKNVQRLTFTDFYLSSDSQIRENENLRRLSIYKESFNQSLLEFINFLNYSNNVRYLNISNCYLGDEGMKYFCKNFNNYNLIELNLTKNQLKENSGFYLAELLPKLDKLETLILADNYISDPGFSSLATAISLMAPPLNNSEKRFVLRYIDLSNNSIKENESRAFVDYLSKYENLEDIELQGNSFGTQTANSIGIYLKIVKGLKRINLSKCELNDESCPLLIKNLDNSLLEEIILDYNPLGQIGAILLGNMVRINKYLKKISLKNCEVNAMSMNLLAKSCENNSTLEEIDLRNNKISYEEYITMIKLVEGKRIRFLIDEIKNSK